jgi:hypothetical protein
MSDGVHTMSELDVIRQRAAEGEGLTETATWSEIFTHFRRRLGVRPAELADTAKVTITAIYQVEEDHTLVSPTVRMKIWDALCFIESE